MSAVIAPTKSENPPQIKTCKICGQEKPLNEYRKSYLSKDGHLHTCKICFQTILTNGQKIKRAHKMAIFLKELPQKKGVLKEAFKKISTVTTDAAARSGVSEFLANPSTDFDLVKSLMEKDVQLKCNRYFRSALDTGNLSEQRDAVQLLAKLTGQSVEKQEHTIVTPQERAEKFKQIAALQADVITLLDYRQDVQDSKIVDVEPIKINEKE